MRDGGNRRLLSGDVFEANVCCEGGRRRERPAEGRRRNKHGSRLSSELAVMSHLLEFDSGGTVERLLSEGGLGVNNESLLRVNPAYQSGLLC